LGILALAVGLAGCAAGSAIQYLPEPPLQADLSEPNYRQIVAANIGSIFPGTGELGALEISGARPVSHLRGPAWLACLRIHADSTPQEYAVFIVGDKIIDTRAGVAVDHCKQQTYEPFDPATVLRPNPTVPQRKKAGR
jgi:hypothetical protein